MIVTHKMVLDMEQAGELLCIDAVQDDRYTRNVELTLMAGSTAWNVPETASAVVRYRKADGIGGQYDALPDGSRAWNANSNVVTVALAPQVLTVPGPVTVSVGFLEEEKEINTFCFLVNVQPNAGAKIAGSEPYYHVRSFLPQPETAAAGQFLQITGVNDQGVITRVTAVDAPIGEPGENGATFTPSVSAEGVLSWTNDKGLENPAPVSIRGPEGPAGPQGAAAVSPVARVTETEEGVEISITDEFGTSKATVLAHRANRVPRVKTDLRVLRVSRVMSVPRARRVFRAKRAVPPAFGWHRRRNRHSFCSTVSMWTIWWVLWRLRRIPYLPGIWSCAPTAVCCWSGALTRMTVIGSCARGPRMKRI